MRLPPFLCITQLNLVGKSPRSQSAVTCANSSKSDVYNFGCNTEAPDTTRLFTARGPNQSQKGRIEEEEEEEEDAPEPEMCSHWHSRAPVTSKSLEPPASGPESDVFMHGCTVAHFEAKATRAC